MKKEKQNYLLIIFIFIALIFLLLFTTKLPENTGNNGDVIITEIVPLNKSFVTDMDLEYSDYIEIYNTSSKEVNLKGYFLSDSDTSNKKWEFPSIIIKSHEYLVVFTSSKDKCDLNTRECHTNFKLSTKGETVSLLNSSGTIISKIKYPKLEKDTSYSLINNEYVKTIGTPFKTNELIEIDDSNNIIINEVTIDSIELFNTSNKDINLSSYSIEDKSGKKYEFNKTTIKAKSYLVVYGSDIKEEKNGKIYLGFKINNTREKLYLYKGGKLIDSFDVGKLKEGLSIGKNDDGKVVIYKNITLGKKNSDKYYLGFSTSPIFSINEVYVEKGTKVSLSTLNGGEIYYTTDGSTPTNKSTKYTGEITIDKTLAIRAISYKDGYIDSDIESRTYIIGRKHDLPVISITTNNNNIYGTSGIFTRGSKASSRYPYYGANFWEDVEVPISFEYYEDGKLGLNFNAGMKVFGAWSRGEAQKSVAIYLRKKYGLQEITYPFFDDNVNTFTKFILRSGGQDFGKLKLKDAFLQQTVVGEMDIDIQDYRPVVVYFNGKYHGIYNIREKTDTTYVERHLGITENEFDFIEKNDIVKAGSITEYNKLLNYVKNNDMTKDGVYEYLDKEIDLQELANYWVVETYFDQFDPINIKFYKAKDGKWRWILFDLDQSFFTWSYQTIKWKLPFEPYAHGNNYYLNTTLMNRIIKNPKFRELYIKTWAKHLKTTFEPNRMIKILDKMVDEIKSEMPYHIKRWYSESVGVSMYTLDNVNEWYNNIAFFKTQLKERNKIALNTIKGGLGLTNEEYQKYFK